jgi:acyl-coenzyme A synthetase/AMP-(fatty) acid ligase
VHRRGRRCRQAPGGRVRDPARGRARTPGELLAFGREHLARYKAPKVVYFARDFPRTRNGKILRREITPGIATDRSKDSDSDSRGDFAA